MAMQAKLLRALQEKEIRRVGGTGSIPVDVRIVAATNRHLARMMREGKFREDLYYRLNVLTISLPPLRERTTDIPRLVQHFVTRHATAAGKNLKEIEGRALGALMQYHWPGNVRQLESAIERAVLLAEGPMLTVEDLPLEVRAEGLEGPVHFEIPDTGLSFEALEKNLLRQALGKGGNVSRAARLLGMSRRTFQYRLAKFGIDGGAERGASLTSPAPDGAPPEPDGKEIEVPSHAPGLGRRPASV